MIKILFVLPKLKYGGAEKQALKFAKELSKINSVEILDYESNEIIYDENIKIFGLNEKILFSKDMNRILRNVLRIKGLLKLVKLIKNSNYDYIIIFNKLFLPISLINYKNSKIVFSIREFNERYFKGIYKVLLKKVNILMTNNYPSYLFIKTLKKKSYFVNNILDLKNTTQKSEVIKNKEYLLVSNLSEHKNIELAIDIFIELKAEGYILKIVGKISDERYFNKILNKMKNSENILYLGYLDENKLEEEYKSSEGLIHTSLKEGTANAILDAINYNKPFVCLNIPENIYLVGEIKECLANTKNEFIERIKNISFNLENNIIDIENNMNYLKTKINMLYSIENSYEFNNILLKNLEEK